MSKSSVNTEGAKKRTHILRKKKKCIKIVTISDILSKDEDKSRVYIFLATPVYARCDYPSSKDPKFTLNQED